MRRKRIRFIKNYKERSYQIGQVGEFEGDFLEMLLDKKYAVEVDREGNELIKVGNYSRKKVGGKKNGKHRN